MSGLEIERKFLVKKGDAYKSAGQVGEWRNDPL